MAGYIGKSQGVTQVDGYTKTEADGKFVEGDDTLYVDETNNRVGIGTSSPSANLHVSNSGAAKIDITDTGGASTRISTANNNSYVGSTTNHPLLFITNDTEKARIDTSGNLKFNSGYGSVATAYGCRAWVNFESVGTMSVRGSGNVSSVGDYGGIDFQINFSSAMPDANYSVVACGEFGSTDTGFETRATSNNYATIWASVDANNTEPATASVMVVR